MASYRSKIGSFGKNTTHCLKRNLAWMHLGFIRHKIDICLSECSYLIKGPTCILKRDACEFLGTLQLTVADTCRAPGCFSYVCRTLDIIITQNTRFHVPNFVEMRNKVTLWHALRVSNWSVPLSSTYILASFGRTIGYYVMQPKLRYRVWRTKRRTFEVKFFITLLNGIACPKRLSQPKIITSNIFSICV